MNKHYITLSALISLSIVAMKDDQETPTSIKHYDIFTTQDFKSQEQRVQAIESFVKDGGNSDTIIYGERGGGDLLQAINFTTVKHEYMRFIGPKEITYDNKVIDSCVKHGMRFSGTKKEDYNGKEIVWDNLFFDILTPGFRRKVLAEKVTLAKICIHKTLTAMTPSLKNQILFFCLCVKDISKKNPLLKIPKPLIKIICNEVCINHDAVIDIRNALKQRSLYFAFSCKLPLEFICSQCTLTQEEYSIFNLQIFDPHYWEANCIDAMHMCTPKK